MSFPAGADTYTLRAGLETFQIHVPQGYREVSAGTYFTREDLLSIEVVAYAPIAVAGDGASDRLIDGFRLGCQRSRPGHPGEFASRKEVANGGTTVRCACRMDNGSLIVLEGLVWTRGSRAFAKSVRLESLPIPGKTQPLAPLVERASAILSEVTYSEP